MVCQDSPWHGALIQQQAALRLKPWTTFFLTRRLEAKPRLSRNADRGKPPRRSGTITPVPVRAQSLGHQTLRTVFNFFTQIQVFVTYPESIRIHCRSWYGLCG